MHWEKCEGMSFLKKQKWFDADIWCLIIHILILFIKLICYEQYPLLLMVLSLEM
jgi:hypothetical protein